MSVKVNLNSKLMKELREKVPDPDARNIDIISEALNLYEWAADQKDKGKIIFSANNDGNDIEEIIITGLEKRRISKEMKNP